MNKFWQQFLPDRFVHEDLQQDVILELIKQQTELIGQGDDSLNPTIALIIEDCTLARCCVAHVLAGIDQKFRYNPEVERIFYAGRHYKCCCFITSQWFTSLHPGVRTNADIVFIFALQNANEIEAVWKNYFGW